MHPPILERALPVQIFSRAILASRQGQIFERVMSLMPQSQYDLTDFLGQSSVSPASKVGEMGSRIG